MCELHVQYALREIVFSLRSGAREIRIDFLCMIFSFSVCLCSSFQLFVELTFL